MPMPRPFAYVVALLVLPPTRALVRRRLVKAAEQRAPGLKTARIRSEGPIVDVAAATKLSPIIGSSQSASDGTAIRPSGEYG